jgi:hypothetical protein
MESLDQKLYRVFSPAPLTAEQKNLYVDLDDVRGHTDMVLRMEKRIRFSDKPIHQVLAGHNGCGKSTELYRLKHHLERPEDAAGKWFVVFVESRSDVDLYDLDFPDVLVAVCRQMVRQVEDRTSIRFKLGFFKDRFERLKELLGRSIDFDEFKLSAGLLELSGAIKGSPDARHKLRAAIDQDANNWLTAANELIDVATLELRKQGYSGLIVIVDDLDKMVAREKDGIPLEEYLFVNRAAQLTGFRCSMVYSIPISLAYSHLEPAVAERFGGEVHVIPMIKVATRPPDSKPFAEGMAKVRTLILNRVESTGARLDQVFFSDQVLDRLIELSGGQPNELMTLVREAIVADPLPIAERALERALREGRREYRRQFLEEHRPILESVRDRGDVNRTRENDAIVSELLKSRAILMYVNDEEWYGLNPMVAAELPPAATTSRAKRSKPKPRASES